MGQFSWMFADKNNKQALNEGCPAYVALPDGGYIYEPCYDGYGNFGGKDIYDLVADWNREYLAKHPEHDVGSHDMYGREIAFPVCRHSWYWKYADLKLTPEEVVKQADLYEYRGIGIDIACYDKQNAALPFPIKICRDKPEPGDYEKLPPSESDPNQGWGTPDNDMDTDERIKMIKAMEFIVRHVNNECQSSGWFAVGVADGDIAYGDLMPKPEDAVNLYAYLEDDDFGDLMGEFLYIMGRAYQSGGLYCDKVLSKSK